MAKDKKRDETSKPKKITVEAEVSLLGLLLAIVSLVGLLNQGFLGSLFTYILVYFFGSMYFVIFIFNIYFGLYLFIKKKLPAFVLGIKGLCSLILLYFILIASSQFKDSSLGTWYDYFINNFRIANEGNTKINLAKLSLTGGGLIGYFSYTLLASVVGDFGAILCITLVILSCLYVLLKKPLIILIEKIIVLFKKIKAKRKEKINNSSTEENTSIENDELAIQDETIEENEIKIDEEKSKLTFDIFNEPIFDEEELIEESTTPRISDEELEFYGEEEIETKSEPLIIDKEVKREDDSFDVYSLLEKCPIAEEEYNLLKSEVENNCEKINSKLDELGIKAKVTNYVIGPSVTRYEIVPEFGVRVNTIANAENDLKFALAALTTRIEAPIPGKSAVGIEVANAKRYPVYLREVLEPFRDNNDKLLVAIGKNLNNDPIAINIDSMPHLLVAGQTGSGKSVCIDSIICSLLMRSTPDDVRLVLIDPKKVGLNQYDNVPHLLCPIIKEAKKASVALTKIIDEMQKRYSIFEETGAKNIGIYNRLQEEKGEKPLYNIVVIIDELSDLMNFGAKDIEDKIQRITQLARAAGIYLIVATQRPSVDVVTGVIKANLPSRIAFSVPGFADSKTILDRGGAENLLGKGDMLLDVSGSMALQRVQGVFISDKEINDIVKYVKNKYVLEYDPSFVNLEEKKEVNELLVTSENNDDLLYEDIKQFVIDNQKATTTILQNKFAIGYARASRMLDRLEEEGIVSSQKGSKPRDVLVSKEDIRKEEENNE